MKQLPDSIQKILRYEFETAKELEGKKIFEAGARHRLVEKSKKAYDRLPREEQIGIFVPESELVLQKIPIKRRDSDYIKEDKYEFNYIWPKNKGFVKKADLETGDIERKSWFIEDGMLYDRIGELDGRYVSPFVDGKPQSYASRAMPYYIPERDFTKSPSYHILKAEGTYAPKKGEIIDYGSVANVYVGEIGKSTGGTQLFLKNGLQEYMKQNSEIEERRVLVEQKGK